MFKYKATNNQENYQNEKSTEFNLPSICNFEENHDIFYINNDINPSPFNIQHDLLASDFIHPNLANTRDFSELSTLSPKQNEQQVIDKNINPPSKKHNILPSFLPAAKRKKVINRPISQKQEKHKQSKTIQQLWREILSSDNISAEKIFTLINSEQFKKSCKNRKILTLNKTNSHGNNFLHLWAKSKYLDFENSKFMLYLTNTFVQKTIVSLLKSPNNQGKTPIDLLVEVNLNKLHNFPLLFKYLPKYTLDQILSYLVQNQKNLLVTILIKLSHKESFGTFIKNFIKHIPLKLNKKLLNNNINLIKQVINYLAYNGHDNLLLSFINQFLSYKLTGDNKRIYLNICKNCILDNQIINTPFIFTMITKLSPNTVKTILSWIPLKIREQVLRQSLFEYNSIENTVLLYPADVCIIYKNNEMFNALIEATENTVVSRWLSKHDTVNTQNVSQVDVFDKLEELLSLNNNNNLSDTMTTNEKFLYDCYNKFKEYTKNNKISIDVQNSFIDLLCVIATIILNKDQHINNVHNLYALCHMPPYYFPINKQHVNIHLKPENVIQNRESLHYFYLPHIKESFYLCMEHNVRYKLIYNKDLLAEFFSVAKNCHTDKSCLQDHAKEYQKFANNISIFTNSFDKRDTPKCGIYKIIEMCKNSVIEKHKSKTGLKSYDKTNISYDVLLNEILERYNGMPLYVNDSCSDIIVANEQNLKPYIKNNEVSNKNILSKKKTCAKR